METIEKNPLIVRASVNEENFFATMKHLFATSRTVLSELMQNARRAGASNVKFDIDTDTRTISISDDGCGIEDFGALLSLATSGWTDESVMKNDKPFGIGFFSVWHCCERVTIYSNGLMLQGSVEDIIARGNLEVSPNDHAQALLAQGTTTQIVLHGVNEQIMKSCGSSGEHSDAAYRELKDYLGKQACGFAIPVFVNDDEMPRPFAQENLEGEQTEIGFVSIRGMHRDVEHISNLWENRFKRYFLQGLPIGDSYFSTPQTVSASSAIIHLDSASFIARMPDRSHLYDAEAAEKRVEATCKSRVVEFIKEQKQTLSPKEFIHHHWTNCTNMGLSALLNDIDWLPANLFQVCDRITLEPSSNFSPIVFTGKFNDGMNLISKDEVLKIAQEKGGLLINEPAYPGEVNETDVTVMEFMCRTEMVSLSHVKLDTQHWVFDHVLDFADEFEVALEVTGASDEFQMEWTDADQVRIGTAKSAKITVNFTGKRKATLSAELNDGWVFESHSETELKQPYTCWHLNGDTDTDAACALSSFTDENDRYEETWETNAKKSWGESLALLYKDSLGKLVTKALSNNGLALGDTNHSQIAVVSVIRTYDEWKPQETTYSTRTRVLDVDHDLLAKLAQNLSESTGISINVEQVGAALASTLKPNEYVGGPQAGQYSLIGGNTAAA